jgi:hypothetical protein
MKWGKNIISLAVMMILGLSLYLHSVEIDGLSGSFKVKLAANSINLSVIFFGIATTIVIGLFVFLLVRRRL